MKVSKILLPLDFSECATVATGLACILARQFQAELHLLHVIEPWEPAAMAPAENYPTQRAEELLAHFRLPGPGAKATRREVRIGDAGQQILEYARELGIDLIVIGSHGRSGLSHLLMGSVAEQVVRHAPCAVMTVRHHARPHTQRADKGAGKGTEPNATSNEMSAKQPRWRSDMSRPAKNRICLWYDGDAEEAARFYAKTFPDSSVDAVHRAPGDYPAGKEGDVLTVEFTVMGIPCLGLNGGPAVKHNWAFSFQVATADQAETDRYWNAILAGGGQANACGWCTDKWGVSWQITPIVLTQAIADPDRAAAKRAFDAMMQMTKIDIATIEAARRG